MPAPTPVASDGRAQRLRAAADERSMRFTPGAPRMNPVLSRAALDRMAKEGRSAVWVVFTDKGIPDERAFQDAVRRAGERFTDRARARRAREQGGTYAPDFDDVPVPARYVDAVAATGASVRHVSRWMNAASVMATEPEARRIADLPFVRAILPLRLSHVIAPVSVGPAISPAPGSQRGSIEGPLESVLGPLHSAALTKPTNYGPSITQLQDIKVTAVHDSGYSGAGVIFGMFDTGFNKSHTVTIQLKRLAEWDFVFEDPQTANEANDAAGQWDHGTGTWGTAGGYWNGNLIGPAYNATFVLAKTEYVPSETRAEEDNWAAAAEWADSLGVDVVSSSLAYLDFDGTADDYTWFDLNGHTTIIAQAAILAARRGILVANAMGNEGPSGRTLWSPADADSILSCGAVTSGASYSIATFSSRGNTADGRIKPDVVAQGVNTYWAVASNNNAIAPASGTSLSTPLVGGAAALVREAHPEWTVAQVIQAMKSTADRANIPDSIYGWGRINTYLAIWGSALGPPVTPRPFDLLVPPTGTTVTTTPVTLRWRRTTDPQSEAVGYTVTLRKLPLGEVVFTTSTPDSFTTVTGYLGPSTTYDWSVTAADLTGHGRAAREAFRFTTGATTDVAIPPSAPSVSLAQNRPNPGVGGTDISFTLGGSGEPTPASLRIFDARGRLVRTLVDSSQPTARQYVIHWDGMTETGTRAAAGTYFYRLRAAGRDLVRRLVLLR
ncbi:MAG TPA: S8 family serine peptidase [Candidatus Eisenbacteria bacterium]|nr:S8 family serine peptidase [Candidatus Eisenbacteria bacterium]